MKTVLVTSTVLLMIAVTTATAQPIQDNFPEVPPYPDLVDDDPWIRTGIIPLDETQRQVNQAVDGQARSTWEVLEAGAATLYQTTEEDPLLVLYRDGGGLNGSDARHGGFRDWSGINAEPKRTGLAAHEGQVGYSPGDGQPDSGIRQVLLPRLELSAGSPYDRLKAGSDASREVYGDVRDTGQGYLDAGFDDAQEESNAQRQALARMLRDQGAPSIAALIDALPSDVAAPVIPDANGLGGLETNGLTHALRFWFRHNLQQGSDGVQFRAYLTPTHEVNETCVAPDCTVLAPTLGYDADIPGFGPAVTGYRDWHELTFDLSRFADDNVQVAVAQWSGQCPRGCEQRQDLFNQSAGFIGFHLDDAFAWAPAPEYSISLQAPHEPDTRLGEQGDVVVPPGRPVAIAVEAGNLGQSSQEITLRAFLEDRDGNVQARLPNQTHDLGPGEVGRLTGIIPSLSPGQYIIRASTTTHDLESKKDDDASALSFRVAEIRDMRAGELFIPGLEGAPPTVPAGTPLSIASIVENRGNVVDSLDLAASLQEITGTVTTGTAVQDASVLIDNATRQVTLAPGEVVRVQWNVSSDEPGQYRFVLQDGQADPVYLTFGIGRSLPPVFIHRVNDEARGSFTGDWTTEGAISRTDAGRSWVQGWHEGPHLPGQDVLFYMGMDHDDPCPAGWTPPCPYALHRAGNDTVPSGVRTPEPGATLYSPAIDVPAAGDPHLIFNHQFATDLRIYDCDLAIPCDTGTLYLNGIVLVEGRVGSRTDQGVQWGEWTQLQSDTTPVMREQTGIVEAGLDNPEHPIQRNYASNPPFCSHPDDPCGWWWPSGIHERVKIDGREYATAADFGAGSPWRMETIPLANTLHGESRDQFFDARGGVVQVRFHMPHAGLSEDAVAGTTQEGWRLGEVAVFQEAVSRQDLRVRSVTADAPYDAERIGLGAGQPMTFIAEVDNVGLESVSAWQIQLLSQEDPSGMDSTCHGTTAKGQPLAPGETQRVRLHCTLPLASGMHVGAEAQLIGQTDDMPLDNRYWRPEPYDLTRHPNLALQAAVTPQTGSPETPRILDIRIHNAGNVPVHEYDLALSVRSQSGLGATAVVRQDAWHIAETIQPGQNVSLATPGLAIQPDFTPRFDLSIDLPTTGDYLIESSLHAANDAESRDDEARLPLRASKTLYANDFEESPQLQPGVVTPVSAAGAEWFIDDAGFRSPSALVATDPETGQLAPMTDTTWRLPDVDLTTVKDATISWQHRYFLEESFDGARLEISLDNGTTWRPLSPRTEGQVEYPGKPILGSSAFTHATPELHGQAFTGDSHDLPGSLDGWAPAEFPLSLYPDLRQRVPFEEFPLDQMAATPLETPVPPGSTWPHPQWTHPSWQVNETDAKENGRYWWIENNTYLTPQGMDGPMWWSGSRGGDARQIYTNLTYDLPAGAVTVTWWDWRAGWQDAWTVAPGTLRDHPDDSRPGRGGQFNVLGDDQTVLEAQVLERRADGWTQRAATIPGGSQFVQFQYIGDQIDVNNRGWYIADVRSGEQALDEPFVSTHSGVDADDIPYSPTGWTCFGAHPCQSRDTVPDARTGGWTIGKETAPNGVEAPVWRFSADNAQGYPHGVDSRLVTPTIDLARVSGDAASLRFDHKYAFDAATGCLVPDQIHCDATEDFFTALDGGSVEVQVFNSTTGRFDDWQPLLKSAPTQTIYFTDATAAQFGYGVVSAEGAPPSLDRLKAMGYPAVMLPVQGSGIVPVDTDLTRCCKVAHAAMPVRPVFSGTQSDWTTEVFPLDAFLGQKVRFALHAYTDPSYSGPSDALFGWRVANVAVEAETFAGQKASLRLRVATDESITPGEWKLDDITIVGEQYKRNLAILPDEAEIEVAAGETATITGEVRNMGSERRDRVAWRVVAEDAGGRRYPTVLEHVQPGDNIVYPGIPSDQARGIKGLDGPFSLAPGGQPGDRIPFKARIDMPQDPEAFTIYLELYEDRGRARSVNGTLVHAADFAAPEDEVPGTTRARVAATIGSTPDVTLSAPHLDNPRRIVASPSSGDPGHDILFETKARNNGSQPQTATLQWRVIDREDAVTIWDATQTLTLPPRSAVHANKSWTPDAAGLYRVEVELRHDANLVATAFQDLPIEFPLQYMVEDFDNGTWTIGFQPHDGLEGRSNQWRTIEGRLMWGPTDLERLQDNDDYCHSQGQALCPMDTCPDCEDPLGPEAWARLPVDKAVDLRLVPGDAPVLTMDHDWHFQPGDGGIVEVAVLRDPDRGTYVCTDDDSNEIGQPKWFSIEPRGGYPGIAGGAIAGPAFTGSGSTRTTIDLADQTMHLQAQASAQSASCRTALQDGLLGDWITLRVRASVDASFNKQGDLGWRIDAIRVGVGELGIAPRDRSSHADRVLPVVPGAAKTFLFAVTNHGPVDDHAAIEVQQPPVGWEATPGADQLLPSGSTRILPLRIVVPPEAPTGGQPLRVAATSRTLGGTADALNTLAEVQAVKAPDISLEVRTDRSEYAPGEPATATVIATNLGEAASREASLLLVLRPEKGASQTIALLELPAMCPVIDCGTTGRTTLNIQWITPDEPGRYALVANVDPDRLLVDGNHGNNVASTVVDIRAREAPDLAVTSLRINGHETATRVEAGELFQVDATITNLGTAEATNVQLQLILAGTTIADAQIPVMPPGASHNISTIKASSAGRQLVEAVVLSDSSVPDSDRSNDQRSLILPVQDHDFVVEQVDDLSVTPGRPAMVQIRVRNHAANMDELVITPAADTGWNVTAYPKPLLALPGQNATAVLLIQPPSNATAGNGTLALAVTPASAPGLAQRVNLTYTTAAIDAGLDVEIEQVALVDATMTVDALVHNLANIPKRFEVSLPELSAQEDHLAVDAHATHHVALQRPVPHQLPPGRLTTPLVVTHNTTVLMQNVSIDIPRIAGIASAWELEEIFTRSSHSYAHYNIDLRNTGNVAITGTAKVEQEGSPVNEFSFHVPVGSTATYTIEVNLSKPMERRTLVLTSNEDGILAREPLPRAPELPDLEIGHVTTPGFVHRQAAAISVDVANQGSTRSDASRLFVYRNTELIDIATIPPIEPGQSIAVDATVTLEERHHVLILVVDGNGVLPETSKENNGISRQVTVAAGDRSVPALGLFAMALVTATASVIHRRRRRGA